MYTEFYCYTTMDRIFSRFLCSFLLISALQGARGSHAALSPEQYWRSILPNTLIPNFISQLLTNGHPYSPAAGLPNDEGFDALKFHFQYGTKFYRAAATQQDLKEGKAVFFLEKNLQQGKKFTLSLGNILTAGTEFLPRGEADSIPFSSKHLTEILARFAVPPGSDDAAKVRHTLLQCEQLEQPANKGEKMTCATSLESIVDFATASLGTHDVNAATTVLASWEQAESPLQEYMVTSVRRMGGTGQLVACHPVLYVYAVFVCHLTQPTRAYAVSLVTKGGAAVEAAAVCHTDTKDWSPNHVSFKVLGVKPGTVPVCHFMQPEAVVWTRRGWSVN